MKQGNQAQATSGTGSLQPLASTPETNALADRYGEVDEASPYWDALDLATKLERQRNELLEALDALATMYGHAWDREDGALVMMGRSIPQFEEAHDKAGAAIKKARGE